MKVYGRVQGVFFRQSAAVVASKLGVFGYIQNLEDGSVEAVYEGNEEAVKKMVEWTKKGPPTAKVTSYRIIYEPYKGEFKSFETM
ncbi:MAG: acylphosphatase [Candidatus Brockarchaeota archaeon]|nr:acylphosphatase [Candidatus Brockarchaeota archaeon]